MKLLAVSALLCAVMALTAADEELDVVKRTGTKASPWEQIARRYFAYVAEYLTWPEAAKNCQELGGHLASMHNLYERNCIKNLINKYGRSDPSSWLGGSDQDQEGTWKWVDGSAFDYDNWCWGEPNNNNGNEHCLFYNAGKRCFQDFPCGDRSPSVCVKAKEPQSGSGA